MAIKHIIKNLEAKDESHTVHIYSDSLTVLRMLAHEMAITVYNYATWKEKIKKKNPNLSKKAKLYSYLLRKRFNTIKYCNRLKMDLHLHHCFSHTKKQDCISLGNN